MHSIMFTLVSIFIAIVAAFVFFGVITTFLGHRKLMNRMTDQVFRQANSADREGVQKSSTNMETPPQSSDFSCSGCGASLSSNTEISPSGDFKCPYCNSWSNVHR